MKQSDILSGNPDADYGVNSENEYASNDLKSQYNLVTHHDTWDWSTLAYKVKSKYFFLLLLSFLTNYSLGIYYRVFLEMSPDLRILR